MQRLLKAYELFNLLSLDVALGAVCCSAWLAGAMKIKVNCSIFVLLGMTVWIIYTVDRLLDVSRMKSEPSTKRHQFHKQYFNILVVFILLLSAGILALLAVVPSAVIKAGIGLSVLVLVHLLLNRYMTYFKELGIALLYTAGILLPAVAIGGTDGLMTRWPLMIGFFLTVLINLVLFSWCEREYDNRDGTKSIATASGVEATETLLKVLFGLQSLIVLIVITRSWLTAIVLLLMNGILLLLFVRRNLSRHQEIHRLLGDAIFLIPGVLLPLII